MLMRKNIEVDEILNLIVEYIFEDSTTNFASVTDLNTETALFIEIKRLIRQQQGDGGTIRGAEIVACQSLFSPLLL